MLADEVYRVTHEEYVPASLANSCSLFVVVSSQDFNCGMMYDLTLYLLLRGFNMPTRVIYIYIIVLVVRVASVITIFIYWSLLYSAVLCS